MTGAPSYEKQNETIGYCSLETLQLKAETAGSVNLNKFLSLLSCRDDSLAHGLMIAGQLAPEVWRDLPLSPAAPEAGERLHSPAHRQAVGLDL